MKLVAIGNADPNGYARASYPQGVENPFVPAVIPYPSNLHGSQRKYSRESFRFMPAVHNVLSGVEEKPEIVRVQEILLAMNLSPLLPSVQAAYEQLEHCAPVLYSVKTINLRRNLEAAQTAGSVELAQKAVGDFINWSDLACHNIGVYKKWVSRGAVAGLAGGVGFYYLYNSRSGRKTAVADAVYGVLMGAALGALGATVQLGMAKARG